MTYISFSRSLSLAFATSLLVLLAVHVDRASAESKASGDEVSPEFFRCNTRCITPCFTSGPLGEPDELFWACQRAIELGYPVPPEFAKECEKIKKCNERAQQCFAACDFYHL